MKIVDLFRPKWKHSDPSVRATAVAALQDQARLVEIARKDDDPNVRASAAAKLDDQVRLADIARADSHETVRLAAVARLHDQESLAALAIESMDAAMTRATVESLTEPNQLIKVALNARDASARYGATRRLRDRQDILTVLREAADQGARATAIGLLAEDDAELMDCALREREPNVARSAVERVRDDTSLASIALRAQLVETRIAAASKLGAPEHTLRVIRDSEDQAVRNAAIGRLPIDGDEAENLVMQTEDEASAGAALERLSSPERLEPIALGAAMTTTRTSATNALSDLDTLVRIARSSSDKEVRFAAIHRLPANGVAIVTLSLGDDPVASEAVMSVTNRSRLELIANDAAIADVRAHASLALQLLTKQAQEKSAEGRELLMRAAWDHTLRDGVRWKVYKQAEEAFLEALAKDDRCFVALLGLGQILAKRDSKYRDAIEYYDRAIAVDDGQDEVWLLRALSLADDGRPEDALLSMDRAIACLAGDPAGQRELMGIRKKIAHQVRPGR